jgi:hypothetical protein
VWHKGEDAYVPLYVGKMLHQYDHRAASVQHRPENTFNQYVAVDTDPSEKCDPGMSPMPQFWVPLHEVIRRGKGTSWVLAYRDIARATDERTLIVAAGPDVGYGHTLPLLRYGQGLPIHCLLAGLNSYVVDYVARLKIPSTHMTFFTVEQLPVLPPNAYARETVAFIAPRVLELTYTAHDIAGFAEDMGYVDEAGKVKPPFVWDEERRLHLKCQLDAMYFRLYGLSREEAAYVLDTFPIVRRHDEQRFGTYRTKELILQYYNAYEAGDMEAWVGG